ncbi:MAG: hypothetical protein LBQ24_06645 [Candidatus Peribacteria bacterium]|jgi:hypothetical protein|nr:hypothetical protein [Candidatus Peribacteria bacterium]
MSSFKSLSISKTSALTIFHPKLNLFTKESLEKSLFILFKRYGLKSSQIKKISEKPSQVKSHVNTLSKFQISAI